MKTMTVEANTRVARAADLLSTRVDEDIIILNMQTDNYVALDEVGRRIWDLLETPRSVDELCQQLNQEFSGDPEQIRADVLAFLNELEADQMLNVLS
jgi:hypothetical protein